MGKYIIGRDASCDIVINDPSVSRRHAELIVDGTIVQIRDLGSSNGTFVNGTKVENSQQLSDYDIVKVASSLVPWKNYLSSDGSSRIFNDSEGYFPNQPAPNYDSDNHMKMNTPNATLALIIGITSVYLPLILLAVLIAIGVYTSWICISLILVGIILSIIGIVISTRCQKVFFSNTNKYSGHNSFIMGNTFSIIGLVIYSIMTIAALIGYLLANSLSNKMGNFFGAINYSLF